MDASSSSAAYRSEAAIHLVMHLVDGLFDIKIQQNTYEVAGETKLEGCRSTGRKKIYNSPFELCTYLFIYLFFFYTKNLPR